MYTDMTELGIFAILIQHMFHIPYVIVEHSTTFLSNINSFIEKLKIKIIIKLSRKVMPVSNALKKSLESIQKANFFIINNVVDTDFFKPPSKKANNRVNQIIHVSLLKNSHKNVSGIIQALGFLRKVRTDFEFHIVGEGLDKETLIQQSNQIQGMDKYIFFHGKVSDETLLSIYQNADLFILNSKFETFGCVLIESISCGVPVISTRCGGPEEIVSRETGILIDIGDMKQLIEAINNILDNKDKYNSNVMHTYAVDNYGYVNIGKTFMNIYEETIRNYDG